MGTVFLQYGITSRRLLLTESMIFGRHPDCGLGVIKHNSVPQFWLETRWMENQWIWRAINSKSDTTGKGAHLNHGWRKFNTKISINKEVIITLLDNSKPIALVEDLYERKRIPLQEFPYLHRSEKGYHVQEGLSPLENGDHFTINNTVYKFWIPTSNHPTNESILSIEHCSCTLDIDLDNRQATFTVKDNQVTIKGECVRILHLYATELVQSPWEKDDGWSMVSDIFSKWIKVGGNPKSKESRIHWERNKIRSQLIEGNAQGADSLFERKRAGYLWYHRLNFNPRNITFL